MGSLENMLAAAKRLETNKCYIPHTPTPPQLAFIADPAFEILYGGAAGGGKSDAILMDLLQWVHIPNYAGIGFRRTYADLVLPGALIDRSHQWLAGTDAAWNGDRKQWRFPSGAVVAFGYLDKDTDKYRYQSAEFQRIDFDELTHFQRAPYTYMLSRCRRTIGIDVPPGIRCGSNPGGVGHLWVKQRFVDVETREGRIFMPAGLKDNPHLDAEEYRSALMNLSPTEQAQLLDGVWEEGEVEGAYYGSLMAAATVDERVTDVRYEPTLPVYTAWDLGMDDETAIWFFQQYRQERRFIDYYQNSGEGLGHYAKVLSEKPYTYTANYLPPDVEVRELGAEGKTRRETLQSLGVKVTVLPPTRVEDGIQAVRDILPLCWFDKVKCKEGIQCLRNYRKEWDEKHQTFKSVPYHDWASHGADSFRYGVMGYRPAAGEPKTVNRTQMFAR